MRFHLVSITVKIKALRFVRRDNCFLLSSYRFVEHASLTVFVFSARTIDEAVAEDVVVDAAVASDNIRSRAGEPFHAVFGRWAFYGTHTHTQNVNRAAN